jgi:hypothetical protein
MHALMLYKSFKLLVMLLMVLVFMFGIIAADSTFSISPLLGFSLIFFPMAALGTLARSGWLDDVSDLLDELSSDIFGE